MEPLSLIAIAALIGYYVFKETPEEKAIREKTAAEYEHRRIQTELEEERREAERRERERPFASAEECFRKEYVSYARMSTYCSCPRRFKLVYMDKVRTRDQGFTNYERGSVLHASIEACLKPQMGKRILRLDDKEIVGAAFGLGYLQHAKKWWSDHRKEEAKRKRDTFRKNAKFLRETFPSGVEVVAVEHELSFQLDGLNFYGIVDLVLRYPDGRFEIVDYKTGMRRPTKEQLEIYSIPFCKTSSRSSIDFRIICVDRKSHYRWTQESQDTAETASRILGIVRTIISDKSYLPAAGSRCGNCGVRTVCGIAQEHELAPLRKVDHRTPRLTRLGSTHEWKHGHEPPPASRRLPGHSAGVKKPVRRGDGSSFSLSKAKRQYYCTQTGRLIEKGEYHFVDHKGKRYCVHAFCEIYPERAMLLMKKGNVEVPTKLK